MGPAVQARLVFAMKHTACVLQEFGVAGMVDFFTPALGLALEVARDGRGIREHSARFLDDGRYAPLMRAGIIRDHAVVDLRSPATSTAQQAAPKVQLPHLYTVLFSDDFKKAAIHHMNRPVVSTVVAGNAGQEARDFLMTHFLEAMTISSDSSE